MKNYISLLLLSFALVSCKTATAKPEKPIAVPVANAAFFREISKKPDFDQVKISSRVDVETGAFIPTLDATIYIEDGQKVWMNMIAVFLNVGRGIATPNGIQGYEKWNKTYIESDFSYLNKMLNVDFIDFAALQNLLLGRTFIPVQEKDFSFSQSVQGYRLNSTKNIRFGSNGNQSDYSVALQYSPTFDLMNVVLTDVKSSDRLEVSYSNWVNFENMRLPKNVKINIKGQKTSQIALENTKFEGSKMATPYSVPANYTKTEIK